MTHIHECGKDWILLGRGMFADVYLYTDYVKKTKVAVKQVKTNNPTEYDKEIAALENEIEQYKKLSHERIVKYIKNEMNKEAFIFSLYLEYMEGGSLASYLKVHGKMTEEKTRNFTKQIAEGIAYLHNQQILHRDIKGHNILLNKECNKIKLSDFGISKRLETISSTHGACTQGKGTANWMAPEILNETDGCCKYGFKADIWSIGCVIVEMLTEHPPWYPSNQFQVLAKLINKESPSYKLEKPSLFITVLLHACFQYSPKKRPNSTTVLDYFDKYGKNL